MCPAMPPAPFPNGIFESATAIVERERISVGDHSSLLLKLSLHECGYKKDVVTGDNMDMIKNNVDTASNNNPYTDAPLSGTLEQLNLELELDTLMSKLLSATPSGPMKTMDTDTHDDISEFRVFI